MYIYNLVSILIFAIILNVSTLRESEKRSCLLFIMLMQLILIAVLRNDSVGADVVAYSYYYERINKKSLLDCFQEYRIEPLYITYNKILSIFFEDPRTLFITNSIIIYTCILKNIQKYSPILWLSLFLYVALGFYNSSFNIARQWIAIAITLFSYKYVIRRQLRRFLICILCATLFHYTAITFVIVYYIYNCKISIQYCIAVIAGSFILSKTLFPIAVNYVLGSLYSYYEFTSSSGGYGMLGMLLAVTIGGILIKPTHINETDKLFYHLMIIGSSMQMFSLSFSLFVRVVLYFQLGMIFFVPIVIANQKRIYSKILISILVIFFTSLYYFNYTISPTDPQGTVPYKFYWENSSI